MSPQLHTPEMSALLSILLMCALLLSFVLWRRAAGLERQLTAQRKELEERHDRIVRQAVEDERARSEEAQRQATAHFTQKLDEQKTSALSVVVHPFVNTEGEKGVFTRQTKVEVGYKYQLFVQGLPCFEPHAVVLESTTHKEVDQQMLDLLKQKAESAAEAAVLVPSGGAAKTAITIAKTVLKLARR